MSFGRTARHHFHVHPHVPTACAYPAPTASARRYLYASAADFTTGQLVVIVSGILLRYLGANMTVQRLSDIRDNGLLLEPDPQIIPFRLFFNSWTIN